VVNICGDKWLTFEFLSKKGIATPQSWLPENLDVASLPDKLVVKPRDGSASLHVHKIFKEMVNTVLGIVPKPIIQEEVQGQEITIDALLDLNGDPVHYVPRRRLKTVGGESIEGVVISDDNIRDWLLYALRAIGEAGGKGPITLQAFLTDAGPVLTEINPRFGGGFPLTNAAGGCYPQWLVHSLAGMNPSLQIGDYKVGLYMTRYYVEHFIEVPVWPR
jgi:carbamoyl-phosphate synthase large subunit